MKIKKPFIFAGVIIILIAGFLSIKTYTERPQDLGPDLVYIGKHTYGCYVFCDSKPSATFYFATDLDKNNIKNYFKSAVYSKENEVTDFFDIGFTTNDNKSFDLSYLKTPTKQLKTLI